MNHFSVLNSFYITDCEIPSVANLLDVVGDRNGFFAAADEVAVDGVHVEAFWSGVVGGGHGLSEDVATEDTGGRVFRVAFAAGNWMIHKGYFLQNKPRYGLGKFNCKTW